MSRGGRRSGAGKPKGRKASHTLEASQARARLIERIHEDMDELYEAWLSIALGEWKEGVVDGKPQRIYTRPPNASAIRDMLDRAMGRPVQPVESPIVPTVDISKHTQTLLAQLNAHRDDEHTQAVV